MAIAISSDSVGDPSITFMVGSNRAFLELLEPVYDRLSRYAMAVTRDEMDAEDLVSATVLAALEQFHCDHVHEHFLHYLITIASRLHKRGRYRERNRAAYDEANAELLRDTSPLPDTSAELRLVMDALNTLPDKMRETVVLFDVSDLSLEEIRKIQGGTLSGVKTRLKRGRERIARALDIAPSETHRMTTTPKHENLNHFAMAQEGYV